MWTQTILRQFFCEFRAGVILHQAADAALPVRWDGRRVLFEISDKGRSFPCAISQAALRTLGRSRPISGAAFVRCFVTARESIETVALRKLKARPADVSGTLDIWADDLGIYGDIRRLDAVLVSGDLSLHGSI